MDVVQENTCSDVLEDALSEKLFCPESADVCDDIRGKLYHPVPGLADDIWSDIEEASFLLGLYIFGKKFLPVKEFVESKTMGQILWFYYGKFYRSEKYRTWLEWQKTMSTPKCIYGQRIFTGVRQNELLSRLVLHAPEDCKNTLLKETRAFGEGKISLKEYVFTLRDKVGLNALVDALGIGKGKQDLTCMAEEPLRSNQVASVEAVKIGKGKQDLTSIAVEPLRSNEVALVEAVGIGKGEQDLTSIVEEPLRSNEVAPVEAVGIGKGKQDLIHIDEEALRINQVAPVEAVGIGKGKQDLTSMVEKPLSSNQVAPLEVVGIGKGKQDLTSKVKKRLRSNQVAPIRQQIPIGKACSTFTPSEIIKLLTGGYMLSKARSSDLFWEAVWPRLLARGWRTKKPSNPDSKQCLLYLAPGVSKYHVKRHVKGKHFFDSISDILSKVVEDPELLEVETDRRDTSSADSVAKRQKVVEDPISPKKYKRRLSVYKSDKDKGGQNVVSGERNQPKFPDLAPSLLKADVSPLKIQDSVLNNPEAWTPKDYSVVGPQKVLEVVGNKEEFVAKEQQFEEKNKQLEKFFLSWRVTSIS